MATTAITERPQSAAPRAAPSCPDSAPVTRILGAAPCHTLGPAEFNAACAALMQRVERDFSPVLVVGIRTGGLAVAEAMARAATQPAAVLPLTCRRPATDLKSRIPGLRRGLALLPEAWCNALRRAEHRWSAARRRDAGVAQVDLDEAAEIAAWLGRLPDGQRILVADDAVDSGATLAAVLQTLRAVCSPRTQLRSAVITVTLERPVVEPDYALYRDVLCRFPWSFDAAR